MILEQRLLKTTLVKVSITCILLHLSKRNIGPCVTSQSKNILKVFEFITPTLIHLTLLSFFPECPNGLGPNPTFDACVGKHIDSKNIF